MPGLSCVPPSDEIVMVDCSPLERAQTLRQDRPALRASSSSSRKEPEKYKKNLLKNANNHSEGDCVKKINSHDRDARTHTYILADDVAVPQIGVGVFSCMIVSRWS